jgi:hypothetical protein
MRYSVWGITYDAACALMDELKAKNISSNITVGGLAIYPENNTAAIIMQDLCVNYNTYASEGRTPKEEDILFRKG